MDEAKKRVKAVDETFRPVVFDPVAYAARRGRVDPEFRRALEALDDEFSALDVLLEARRRAGLTQAAVAKRMGVAPASLARIEASAASRRHAPSLATLRKYAEACGLRLTLGLR